MRFYRDVDLFLLRVRLIEDDALALDLLRLQPPSIDDREADDAIALHRRRQVHQHAVLADDAKVEEPAVVAGHDAANGERFGEPEGQCREREGAHPDLERRASLDPHPIRRKGHLDVLTQDVILDELVFAVEAPARGQLLRRGVDGDVPPPPSIEQRDVFRVLRRSGIRQGAESPCPHLGEEIADRWNQRPALAAQIAQVQVEGLPDAVVEEVRGAAEIASRDGHRLECRHRQHIVDLPRPHPDEHRIELGRERILAAEDADLRALGGIRGRERHPAAPEQDDRGRPLGCFGDERGTGWNFELEVRRLNGQVTQLELFRRIESELVQSADGGELLDLGDAARVSIPGSGHELGAPGGDGRLVAVLAEDLEEENFTLGFERCTVTFLDNEARWLRHRERGEHTDPGSLRRDSERQDGVDAPGSRGLLELLDEGRRRIAAARLPGGRHRPEHREDEKGSQDHEAFNIRPGATRRRV